MLSAQSTNWLAQHKHAIESAFTLAAVAACREEAQDPLEFIIQHLEGQRQAQDPPGEGHPGHLGAGSAPPSIASPAATLPSQPPSTSAPPPPPSGPAASSPADASQSHVQGNHSKGDGVWTATSWLSTLDAVTEVVAACLLGDAPPDDELAAVRALDAATPTEAELEERLGAAGLLPALAKALHSELHTLNVKAEATGKMLHDKFAQQEGAFTLKYGDLSTFFGGLEAKIGAPLPNVNEAMANDHTNASDSRDPFTTGNYGITTTPEMEWWFVADPSRSVAWPDEARLRGSADAHKMRKPMPLLELNRKLDEINVQLNEMKETQIILEEAFGARLYTGPMFVKLNDLLRGFGAALAGCKGNKYITTTHVINSVIVKVSKLTRATKVFRGVAGGVLPASFWEANKQGVKGGVESAFMSTTFDRDVAMHYASVPGKPALVFEFQLGMIDRGAKLGWISQYPFEEECLFAPLTGIEVLRTRIDGAVLVIEARLSINLNALTIEQVVGKRKKLLRDMASAMVLEVRQPLSALGGEVATKGVSQLKERLDTGALKEDATWYNVDSNFEAAVKDAMAAKRDVMVDAERLPLHASSVDLRGWSLTQPGRASMLASWLQAGPAATSLILDRSPITQQCAEEVAMALKENVVLTECNFRGAELNMESAVMLSKVSMEKKVMLFGIMHDQKEAVFSGERLGPAEAILIASDLTNNASLTAANLLLNRLDKDSATMLTKIAAEKKISLCGIAPDQTSADFRDIGLGPIDSILIASDIHVRSSLTEVDLSENELGNDGAEAIAAGMKGNTMVKTLNLAGSRKFGSVRIGPKGGAALAEMLGVNASLTELDVCFNSMDEEGKAAIREAVRGKHGFKLDMEEATEFSSSAAAHDAWEWRRR